MGNMTSSSTHQLVSVKRRNINLVRHDGWVTGSCGVMIGGGLKFWCVRIQLPCCMYWPVIVSRHWTCVDKLGVDKLLHVSTCPCTFWFTSMRTLGENGAKESGGWWRLKPHNRRHCMVSPVGYVAYWLWLVPLVMWPFCCTKGGGVTIGRLFKMQGLVFFGLVFRNKGLRRHCLSWQARVYVVS